MCNAVSWPEHFVRFADPEAELPVLTRTGGISMVRWGVHYGEAGHPYPKGPCARLESIRDGRWRRLNPRPVRIAVASFGERSPVDRCNYWFSVPSGAALQGLFVPPGSADPDGRVYVVTVSIETALVYGLKAQFALPAGGMPAVHERWPRLVSLSAGEVWLPSGS